MDKNLTKRWLRHKYKHHKRPLAVLVLMSIVLSVTAVLFAYVTKLTLDGAQARDMTRFTQGALLVVALLIFQILFKMIYTYLVTYTKTKTEQTLKHGVYTTILKKKMNALSGTHSGALMNYLDSDVKRVSEGLVEFWPRMLFLVLRFVFAFALLFMLDLYFALIMLVLGLILITLSTLVRNAMKRRHHKMQDAESRLRSFMQEGLEHIMLIKAFEAEDFTQDNLGKNQQTFIHAKMHKERLSIFAGTALNGFFSAGYAFAIIYGAYQIGMNALTFGSLVAIIQLVEYMQAPFSGLGALLPKYYAMAGSAERLVTLESLPEEHKRAQTETPDFHALTLSNVSFAYDQALVLKNLSFTVNKGDFVHLKGESGIGKTTLFKLLLGLNDVTDGTIHINGEHTVSENTRHYFTYVPQGLMILSGSIRDNLIYNQEGVTEDELINAVKVAELYDDIMALPLGFDTALFERGQGLSEGQLQRLALARSVLKKAPILLLDEITSALDEATEKRVLENIKAMTNKTVILISHRKLDEHLIDHAVHLG